MNFFKRILESFISQLAYLHISPENLLVIQLIFVKKLIDIFNFCFPVRSHSLNTEIKVFHEGIFVSELIPPSVDLVVKNIFKFSLQVLRRFYLLKSNFIFKMGAVVTFSLKSRITFVYKDHYEIEGPTHKW